MASSEPPKLKWCEHLPTVRHTFRVRMWLPVTWASRELVLCDAVLCNDCALRMLAGVALRDA
jgi:hypothetical protein